MLLHLELADTYEVCFETQEGEEESPLGGTTGGDPSNVSAISSSSSTLDPTQTPLLEAALVEFKNYCDIYNYIFGVLVYNSIKIPFRMDPSLPKAAATYPSDGSIVFRYPSDITVFNLQEELIHRFQILMEPDANSLMKNSELEVKVLMDYIIYAYDKAGVYRGGYFLQDRSEEYRDWIDALGRGATFDLNVFNSFAEDFEYREGNYYDPNYVPNVLINILNDN